MAARSTPTPGDHAIPRHRLVTKRLELRAFEPADAADVHAVWNDETYLRFAPVGLPTAGADLETAAEWCARGVEERRRTGQAASFAVSRRGEGRLVGHVALIRTDWTAMVTEVHYWTAPWGRGNGYAAEAARAVAAWALTELGFVRVALAAVVDNVASHRVAKAAGFQFEGVMRNVALTRAGRGDFALYSLIPRDLASRVRRG
jgi:RimJ/RimL family protein N-acetyltransferase